MAELIELNEGCLPQKAVAARSHVRFWPKADIPFAPHMSVFGNKADMTSAFVVAVGSKAACLFAPHMSAFDPKRTSPFALIEARVYFVRR